MGVVFALTAIRAATRPALAGLPGCAARATRSHWVLSGSAAAEAGQGTPSLLASMELMGPLYEVCGLTGLLFELCAASQKMKRLQS